MSGSFGGLSMTDEIVCMRCRTPMTHDRQLFGDVESGACISVSACGTCLKLDWHAAYRQGYEDCAARISGEMAKLTLEPEEKEAVK